MPSRSSLQGYRPLLSCVAIALAFFSAPAIALAETGQATSGPKVAIGSKSFTEGVILGEVLRLAAKSAGADARHNREMGGTPVVWQALNKGQIDAYVEYSGTLMLEILAKEGVLTDDEVQKSLAAKGLKATERLGFQNTYALGMRRKDAEARGIKSISDLAKALQEGKIKLAFSEEFMSRADAWKGLREKYHFPDVDPKTMDHTIAYRSLSEGAIDVTDIYTTDAEVRAYDLIPLEDDRAYFAGYYAVILYRADLEERAPQVVAQFNKLAGKIGNEVMMKMNQQVRLGHKPEALVASAEIQRILDYDSKENPSGSWATIERIFVALRQHLLMVAISLSVAIIVAIPLGIVAYRHPRVGFGILSIASVVQTIPAMALFVFLIPLLKTGLVPAIVALFLYSILPILRGTYTGLRGIQPSLIESAQSLGLPANARLRLIELPLALPSILSGIKTAAVINVGTATIGAIIGAGGLGQSIIAGVRNDDIWTILEGAVPAALLAIVVQRLFDRIENWMVPEGLRGKR